eukprot:748448-Hanusia_phi.AAC.3
MHVDKLGKQQGLRLDRAIVAVGTDDYSLWSQRDSARWSKSGRRSIRSLSSGPGEIPSRWADNLRWRLLSRRQDHFVGLSVSYTRLLAAPSGGSSTKGSILTGLVAHPTKDGYAATCATRSDSTPSACLQIYNDALDPLPHRVRQKSKRECVVGAMIVFSLQVMFEEAALSIDYNPDGSLLVVGTKVGNVSNVSRSVACDFSSSPRHIRLALDRYKGSQWCALFPAKIHFSSTTSRSQNTPSATFASALVAGSLLLFPTIGEFTRDKGSEKTSSPMIQFCLRRIQVCSRCLLAASYQSGPRSRVKCRRAYVQSLWAGLVVRRAVLAIIRSRKMVRFDSHGFPGSFHELIFWVVDEDGNIEQIEKQGMRMSDLRNVVWWSTTCLVGWEVQAVWNDDLEGRKYAGPEITSLASNHTKADVAHVLAFCDDDGTLGLLRYPATSKARRERKRERKGARS